MATRMLLFDETVKAEVLKVRAHAAAHVVPLAVVQQMAAGQVGPIGDLDPGSRVIVPDGYRCCYSEEEQPAPMGVTRHLSISVAKRPGDAPDALPSPASVGALMVAFGFSLPFAASITVGSGRSMGVRILGTTWIERGQAVNIVEKKV